MIKNASTTENRCSFPWCQRTCLSQQTACSDRHIEAETICLIPGCDNQRMIDEFGRLSFGCSQAHENTIKSLVDGLLGCDFRPKCNFCTNNLPDGRELHDAIITEEGCACAFIVRCESCEKMPHVVMEHCTMCESA